MFEPINLRRLIALGEAEVERLPRDRGGEDRALEPHPGFGGTAGGDQVLRQAA